MIQDCFNKGRMWSVEFHIDWWYYNSVISSIPNYSDLAEELIRQFEDYMYSISDKGKTITYSNGTKGMHDDGVSRLIFRSC